MESNKAFGIYVAVLVGGILSVVSASVMAGVTTLPGVFTFVEHVSLSLLFRAAYKSFDGPYDIMATISARRDARTAEAATPAGIAGAAS